MINSVDQVFVDLKAWLVHFFPAGVQPFVSIVLSMLPIISVFPLLFAITTVLERKGLGRLQNRLGPNRVGPYGWFQPIADGVKAIIKEDIVPFQADKIVHFLAPVALVAPVFLAYSVLPVGRNMAAIELDAGLLFFFAIGASSELAVFMAGWSSRNKYALMGAMRAIAQMISYELPLILSALTVVLVSGSLDLVKIVNQQGGYFGWNLFNPWGLAGFVLFMIAASAESNRTPFDLPEAESELVAGYFTEYSGFKFALFFLGEYLGLFAVSSLGITLFLGGWQAPFPFLNWIPSYLWFFGKLLALIFMFIWVRGTIPRLRMDQLLNLAWKFLIPMCLVDLLAAALWSSLGPGLARWLVTFVLVFGSYLGLGRALTVSKGFKKRTYQFAT